MVHRPVRECVDAGGLIAQLHTAAGTVQRLLQVRKGLQIPAAEDCGDFLHPVIDQAQQTVAVKVADGRRQRVKAFLDSIAGDSGNHRPPPSAGNIVKYKSPSSSRSSCICGRPGSAAGASVH